MFVSSPADLGGSRLWAALGGWKRRRDGMRNLRYAKSDVLRFWLRGWRISAPQNGALRAAPGLMITVEPGGSFPSMGSAAQSQARNQSLVTIGSRPP